MTKHVQLSLVDGIVPVKIVVNNDDKIEHSICAHSLLRDITIRMPPRATSLKRIWNPRNSLPDGNGFRIAPIHQCHSKFDLKLTNNHEHSEGLPRVFHLRQEFRRKAERECDFRWLVKVGFQYVPVHKKASIIRPNSNINAEHTLVENEEALENLQLMLVCHSPSHLVMQFLIRERWLCLKTLV